MPQSSRIMVTLRDCCSHRAISALVAAFPARGRKRASTTRRILDRGAGLVEVIAEQSYRGRRGEERVWIRKSKALMFQGSWRNETTWFQALERNVVVGDFSAGVGGL